MTLVVTLYVREGIVMASDSRMSLEVLRPGATIVPGVPVIRQFAHTQTDSIYKTYLLNERVGVSLFGGADIEGTPISGFMETFVRKHQRDTGTVEHFARAVIQEFRADLNVITTGFHVAGYDSIGGIERPVVYRLPVASNELELINPDPAVHGATWDGESDVMDRLTRKLSIVNDDGSHTDCEFYEVTFRWFTLQDAIDFALYAIQVTANTMRFQTRESTVGGPVDVLVIRPDGTQWLRRKMVTAVP